MFIFCFITSQFQCYKISTTSLFTHQLHNNHRANRTSNIILQRMLSKLVPLPFLLPIVLACLGYEGGIPTSTAHHSNSAVIEIAAGEVFDAGWAKYDRGSGACKGSTEGDWRDAVFYLHSGATLRNVIIGKDQAEGVHCDGACTLEFVWFEDVCEDAISIVCCSALLQH